MARKEKRYIRLPGKGRAFLGYGHHTLWLGSDHLLAIDSKIYVEDYKRFYHNDIEALIIRKTRSGAMWNVALGILLALCGMLAVTLVGGGAFFFLVLSTIFFFFLLVNCLRGPTCVCHIQTAVQREALPSLGRLRVARKAVNRLLPFIEGAQGRLSAEGAVEIDAALATAETSAPGAPPVGKPLRHEPARAHAALFSLLLVAALFTFIALLFHDIPTLILTSLAGAGVAVCAIVALVKQYNSDVSAPLRIVTWITLGFVCVSFILAYVQYFAFIVTIDDPAILRSQWATLKAYSGRFPLSSHLTTGIYVFWIACESVLGLLGLVLVREHQKNIS